MQTNDTSPTSANLPYRVIFQDGEEWNRYRSLEAAAYVARTGAAGDGLDRIVETFNGVAWVEIKRYEGDSAAFARHQRVVARMA
jgi:hypothetical protein